MFDWITVYVIYSYVNSSNQSFWQTLFLLNLFDDSSIQTSIKFFRLFQFQFINSSIAVSEKCRQFFLLTVLFIFKEMLAKIF